jgi:hypothetical protein
LTASARAARAPAHSTTPGRLLLALLACGCASGAASQADTPAPTGVGHFKRPRGMPIGADPSAAAVDPRSGVTVDALDPPPAEVMASDVGLSAASEARSAGLAASVPCTGCLELNVYVNDINQRDEFAFAANGARVARVVWTIRVNFNSDQLAVQPFIDDQRGKYTSLHVNTFPLGEPVEIEQPFKGKADAVGLIVGSSGAWTGDQTMSVFVDSVSVEGPQGFTKTFARGDEGLAPRTHNHHPKTVPHPDG